MTSVKARDTSKRKGSAAKLVYADADRARFEARLHKNAKTAPGVPALISTKGKRNKFTGMTTSETVASLKALKAKKKGEA
jgi:hypothetical protein